MAENNVHRKAIKSMRQCSRREFQPLSKEQRGTEEREREGGGEAHAKV